MVLKVFTVFDDAVKAFNAPFCMRASGEAIRGFQDVVNDPKTQFSKSPQDYTLFEIAEYDDQTGRFKMHDAPMSLGNAVQFVTKQ